MTRLIVITAICWGLFLGLLATILVTASNGSTSLRDHTPAQVERQYQQYRACMHYLGQTPRRTNREWETTPSFAYRGWLYWTWRERKLACLGDKQRADSDVRYAIRLIFQGPGDPRYPYTAAEQAVRVAWCESRWTTTDKLGQYEGVFQMGTADANPFGGTIGQININPAVFG